MEWCDEGIVIGVRRHGETSAVIECLTREHGRHLGLVRGGRSSRQQALLQTGNALSLVWRARLEHQLGTMQVEALRLESGRLIASALALYGLSSFASMARLLPERDPNTALYEAACVLIRALDDPILAGPLMARFELALLAELGFGLDLASCAATGSTQDLIFVSPRTGRAVGAPAGAVWAGRLLDLPGFLLEAQGRALPTLQEVLAGLRLTGHFLSRNVFEPRGLPLPEARALFLSEITRRG